MVMLVSKPLTLSAAFLVPFKHTMMDRRAIFIDLPFKLGEGRDPVLVRISTTHLESYGDGGTRKQQMETISSYLNDDEVHCGIIGGDLNAHALADEPLAEECGLTDVWSRGIGDGEGLTWGFSQKQFHQARFDKVLLTRPDRMQPTKAISDQIRRSCKRKGASSQVAPRIQSERSYERPSLRMRDSQLHLAGIGRSA